MLVFGMLTQALRRLGKPMAVADDLAFEGGDDRNQQFFKVGSFEIYFRTSLRFPGGVKLREAPDASQVIGFGMGVDSNINCNPKMAP